MIGRVISNELIRDGWIVRTAELITNESNPGAKVVKLSSCFRFITVINDKVEM